MDSRFLEAYYNEVDEDARLRSRHGQVEFLTTMRYVEKYLLRGDRVLEIGAGTGRYSHELARRGWEVDAVELIAHNIDLFRRNTLPGEQVRVEQGNALDLSRYADETYDMTLLLGPMYHLYTFADQLKALSEAVRVTKKGGIVCAAYCGNDATMVQFCFRKGMILRQPYAHLVDRETFKASSTPEELFQLCRVEDIDALNRFVPVRRLHLVGTDMATLYMPEVVDEMEDELFELYLKYHFSICERSDMVGVSHHMLDVLRREG